MANKRWQSRKVSLIMTASLGKGFRMRMFGPVFGALLLAAVPVGAVAQDTSASSADAAELAEARAIIDVMFPPAQREQMFDKVLTDLTNQFRQSMPAEALNDPGLKAILDEFLASALARERPMMNRHLPEIMDSIAQAYVHEFSLAELKDIHAFALTPAGSHYLSRSSALIADPAVARVNTRIMAEAQALSRQMEDDLKAKIIAYLKAHPDVVKKLSAQAQSK